MSRLGARSYLTVDSVTKAHKFDFARRWFLENEKRKRGVSEHRKNEAIASSKASRLAANLDEDHSLNSLSGNPLILTMIVIVSEFRGSMPNQLHEIYRETCDVMLSRRNLYRGIESQFTFSDKLKLAEKVGFNEMQRTSTRLTSKDVEVLNEVSQSSGIILKDENGSITFAHRSIMEYLCASHINSNKNQAVLRNNLKKDDWFGTFSLYVDLSASDDEFVMELASLTDADCFAYVMLAVQKRSYAF